MTSNLKMESMEELAPYTNHHQNHTYYVLIYGIHINDDQFETLVKMSQDIVNPIFKKLKMYYRNMYGKTEK